MNAGWQNFVQLQWGRRLSASGMPEKAMSRVRVVLASMGPPPFGERN